MEFTDEEIEAAARAIFKFYDPKNYMAEDMRRVAKAALQAFAAVRMKGDG